MCTNCGMQVVKDGTSAPQWDEIVIPLYNSGHVSHFKHVFLLQSDWHLLCRMHFLPVVLHAPVSATVH